jgi:hypothetical protein
MRVRERLKKRERERSAYLCSVAREPAQKFPRLVLIKESDLLRQYGLEKSDPKPRNHPLTRPVEDEAAEEEEEGSANHYHKETENYRPHLFTCLLLSQGTVGDGVDQLAEEPGYALCVCVRQSYTEDVLVSYVDAGLGGLGVL